MRPGCGRPAVSRLSYDTISCQVWLDPVPERPGPAQEICQLHTSRLTVPRGWVLCDRRGDAPSLFVPSGGTATADATAGPDRPAQTSANGTGRSNGTGRQRSGSGAAPRRGKAPAEPAPALFEPPVEPAPALFEPPFEPDDSGPPEVERPTGPRNGSPVPTERRVAATVPLAVEHVEAPAVGTSGAEQPHVEESDEPVVERTVVEHVVVERVVVEEVAVQSDPAAEPSSEQAAARAEGDVEDPDPEPAMPTSPLLARAFRATGPQRSVLTHTLLNEAD
jgi:hypothetical protein